MRKRFDAPYAFGDSRLRLESLFGQGSELSQGVPAAPAPRFVLPIAGYAFTFTKAFSNVATPTQTSPVRQRPSTHRGCSRAARIQSVESRPFQSGATEFLCTAADVSVNITSRTASIASRTDFALTGVTSSGPDLDNLHM